VAIEELHRFFFLVFEGQNFSLEFVIAIGNKEGGPRSDFLAPVYEAILFRVSLISLSTIILIARSYLGTYE
jgi:hypothetical protein